MNKIQSFYKNQINLKLSIYMDKKNKANLPKIKKIAKNIFYLINN